jgi:serine protease Do
MIDAIVVVSRAWAWPAKGRSLRRAAPLGVCNRGRVRDGCWIVIWLTIFGTGCLVSHVPLRAQSATETPPATGASASAAVDLKAVQQQAQATIQRVLPAVVSVGPGSGVVISEDGYVLTVAHVGTRAGRRISITFPDGRRVRGRTLGNDNGVDAGLVKIEDEGPWPYVPMGRSSDLQAGQWCLAMGYPVSFERGKPAAVRIGRVLRNLPGMVVTDCTIMGGDSGGPLFDLDGNVIAVSSRCDMRLTTNIHVPVDCYHDTWARLVAGEDFDSLAINVAFLGIAQEQASEEARIGEVFAGTGAQRAGLRPGDMILRFDGVELSRYADLPPLIEKKKPGDEVEIEIRRGDETLTVTATLGERSN